MNIGAFPSSPTVPSHRGQSSPPSHITATNLTRLLSRLDQKLGFGSIHGDAEHHPPSSLERAKIAANLEYARNLLLSLEKETEAIRSLSQRQSILAKLSYQKQTVRRLNEKLQMSAHDADEEDDETDNEMRALDSDIEDSSSSSSDSVTVSALAEPPTYSLEDPGAKLEKVYPPSIETSNLRNRFPTQQESRAALFNNCGEESTELTEKQLDTQRSEQEDITTDMLTLAQALKQNSLRFSEELQKEKGLLNLVADGLDKNVLGIEGAGKKMGQLRRNEHVGWLWGILYPVIIVVLGFLTLFILFFAPKLRWW